MTFNERHHATRQLLQHFGFAHLSEPLRSISAASAGLALSMTKQIPDGPELSAGLRHLLEAKDCFVRAARQTSVGEVDVDQMFAEAMGQLGHGGESTV